MFLKNFAKLAVKHLWQSLFLIKLLALGLQIYQKEALAQLFSFECCKIFKNTFFYRTPLVAASLTGFITLSENHLSLKFAAFSSLSIINK